VRRAMIVGLALLLVVPLTGCAKAAEKVSEKVAEKAIENASGGNANVDLSNNGGTVKVQTDQGSATYGGGEIPDSIDVPFPSGGTVMVSTEASTGASVMVQYDGGNFDDIVATFQNWVDNSSDQYEPVSVDAGGVRTQSWSSETTTIGVQTCGSDSGSMDSICVYVTVNKS